MSRNKLLFQTYMPSERGLICRSLPKRAETSYLQSMCNVLSGQMNMYASKTIHSQVSPMDLIIMFHWNQIAGAKGMPFVKKP